LPSLLLRKKPHHLLFSNNAAEKKQKREQHHDVSQVGLGVNVNGYPGVYGAPQVRAWYRLGSFFSVIVFAFLM
jgi:hypothetical protein